MVPRTWLRPQVLTPSFLVMRQRGGHGFGIREDSSESGDEILRKTVSQKYFQGCAGGAASTTTVHEAPKVAYVAAASYRGMAVLAGGNAPCLRSCPRDRTSFWTTAMIQRSGGITAVDRAVLEHLRQLVAARQWLVVRTPHDVVVHTVGLTTFRLPELVVAEPRPGCDIGSQLDRWAARLVAGELELGVLVRVHDLQLREHTFLTRRYDPEAGGGLVLARALYGRLAAWEIDVASCRCGPCRSGLYTPQAAQLRD